MNGAVYVRGVISFALDSDPFGALDSTLVRGWLRPAFVHGEFNLPTCFKGRIFSIPLLVIVEPLLSLKVGCGIVAFLCSKIREEDSGHDESLERYRP